MKCRAKRVHAPRSRPLFTRVLHAARSPSTQRRSRPPFTRFCNVHALCSRIYRPVHAHRSRFRCTVHAFGAPFTRGAHPFTRTATPVRRTGRVSLPEPTTERAPEEKKAWARARGARRVVDVSAGRRSFCTGALSQRLSVNPLAHLHKRPCKRTGAERNVHHTPSSSSPCPRLLLLRRALRRGLGSSSTVSGSSGETGIPCARHAAGRCTFAAAAPSWPLHLRACSAPSRMLVVPPLAGCSL